MNNELRKGISDAIKNKRDFDIILLRLKGIKLDDVGEKFDITRERVRQLELRGKDNIIDYIESISDKEHFIEYYNGEYIDADRIKESIGDVLWDVVLYSYDTKRKTRNTIFNYSKYMDTLTTYDVDKLHEELERAYSECDTTLTNQVINQVGSKLKKSGFFLEDELILTCLYNMGNREYGEFILRDNANIGESIRNEIKYNYKDGVKVSSEEEISELRDIIEKKYGHEGIKNKNIISRIQQSLYLWDASTYNHEDNMKVDDDLRNDILGYIYSMFDSGTSRLPYKKIYSVFEEDIKKHSNFINHNSLHGWLLMLNDLEDENYVCIKFYVCKNGTEDIKSKDYFSKVEKYLRDKPKGASTIEIADGIPGFDKSMVKYTSMYYPEVVKWGKSQYINLKAIEISDKDKKLMKDIIIDLMDNEFKYTSKYILFEEYKKNYSDLLNRLNIGLNKNKLFDLNKFIFQNDFSFNPPHIVANEITTEDGFTSEDFAKLLIDKGYEDNMEDAIKKTIKIYKNDLSITSL